MGASPYPRSEVLIETGKIAAESLWLAAVGNSMTCFLLLVAGWSVGGPWGAVAVFLATCVLSVAWLAARAEVARRRVVVEKPSQVKKRRKAK